MTDNDQRSKEIIAQYFQQQILDGSPKETCLSEVENRGYERDYLEKIFDETFAKIESSELETHSPALASPQNHPELILDELPLIPPNLEQAPKWQKQAIFCQISAIHRDISMGESKESILQNLINQGLSLEQAESLYQRVCCLHDAWQQNPEFPHSFLDFIKFYETPVAPEGLKIGLYLREFGISIIAIIMMTLATLFHDPGKTIYFNLIVGLLALVSILDRWKDGSGPPK